MILWTLNSPDALHGDMMLRVQGLVAVPLLLAGGGGGGLRGGGGGGRGGVGEGGAAPPGAAGARAVPLRSATCLEQPWRTSTTASSSPAAAGERLALQTGPLCASSFCPAKLVRFSFPPSSPLVVLLPLLRPSSTPYSLSTPFPTSAPLSPKLKSMPPLWCHSAEEGRPRRGM